MESLQQGAVVSRVATKTCGSVLHVAVLGVEQALDDRQAAPAPCRLIRSCLLDLQGASQ